MFPGASGFQYFVTGAVVGVEGVGVLLDVVDWVGCVGVVDGVGAELLDEVGSLVVDELEIVLELEVVVELELKVDELLDELNVEELLEVELDVDELELELLELLEIVLDGLLEIVLDELLDEVELEPEVDTLSSSFLSVQPVKIAEIAKIPAISLVLSIFFLPNCVFVIL